MNYRTSTEPSSETGRFGDIGTNIPVKLTKEELTELSTVKPSLACLHVAARVGIDRSDNLSMPAILASDAVRFRGRIHRIAPACTAGADARRRTLSAAAQSAAQRLDVGSSPGVAASGYGATVPQESFCAS